MAGQRGDLDVVEHGEPREGSHDLEGAREAEPADVVRLEPPEAPLAEPDLARVGSEKPREQVEDGGLPGPVGSDEADHLAVGHGQVEALHGEEASEALGEPAHLEQAQRAILHDRARRATKGAAPWGRKSTTAMRSEPYTIRWPPDQPVAAKYLRESSASGERMKEPRTGPSGVP